MRQYKRPSKSQITAVALGALAVGAFGATDVYADTTTALTWNSNTEYTRPISDSSVVMRTEHNQKHIK